MHLILPTAKYCHNKSVIRVRALTKGKPTNLKGELTNIMYFNKGIIQGYTSIITLVKGQFH